MKFKKNGKIMKEKVAKFIVVLVLLTLTCEGFASDNLNCVLKKVGSKQPATKLMIDTKEFAYKAQLDSVSAEVGFYFFGGGVNEAIETMTLKDNQTGIGTSFLHNAECTHNECPNEQVDIKTAWHQLDLGTRGIYQVWCTLH